MSARRCPQRTESMACTLELGHGGRHFLATPVNGIAPDPVNHPGHYSAGGIEAIDVIEAWGLGFCLGNTVKYIARAGRKGDALEDLKKAAWYLSREIERRGGA